MRNPKNKGNANVDRRHVSPYPSSFNISGKKSDPENIKREKSTNAQKDWSDGTIIYGDDNALPLRIAKLVQESPATSACLKTISQFIKGASFADKDLMKLKLNKYGLTLWELHSQLSDILPIFEGFAVNFKYNASQKINSVYILSFESCRFKKPKDDQDDNIRCIVYNPYVGTDLYDKKFTTEYHVFDPTKIMDEYRAEGIKYKGQVHYFGKTKPLYRFYPVPDYWSAKKWIEVDAKVQEFHAENLENGFFQSVMMSVIGDPNKWTQNPRLQVEKLKSDGVTKYKEGSITVGEEFNQMMAESFSGSRKAGNVMVQWANNQDQVQKIQAFPNNTNADLFIALQDLCTKNITIATGVPSILANISEGVSLGSAGSEIQKAIELMQSRVTEWQNILTQFYNEVLLPNLETGAGKEVKIVNFSPVSQEIKLEDKFWEVLTDDEKRLFIESNLPNVKLLPKPVALPGQPALPGQTLPTTAPVQQAPIDPNQDAINKIIRSMSRSELSKFWGYVNDYKSGRANLEQTKVFLRAYMLTDEQIMLFLQDPEGDDTNTNTIVP